MIDKILRSRHIILASGSPRRQEFLKQMGLDFEVRLKPIEEIFPDHLEGPAITDYLAELKASAFEGELNNHEILITSDTIVWHNGKALGKPGTTEEAREMLSSLSGKSHEVITSVCFKTPKETRTVNATTRVIFRDLTEEEINFYIQNYKPFDKAGSYGIQEWIGLIGIDHIEGSYFNVVGLPTHLVHRTLMEIIGTQT